MRRRLFNLAAAVSLALCVATGVLWVRTLFIFDYITYVDGPRFQALETSSGVISYNRPSAARKPSRNPRKE